VNIHHLEGSDELLIQDNHPPMTDVGKTSNKTTPLKLVEDDDFEDGFFFPSRS
jgi:hypothetical protein